MRTAEALREHIADYRFVWEDRTFRLGVSVGVVPITAATDDVASLLSAADSACAAAKDAGPPPILDRELFFGDPEISGAQISPDGKLIAFIKPLDGTRNVWVKKTEEPFASAKPITAETKRPIPAYFWSRDGKYVLFVQDQGGDENYNVFAVDPAAAPAAGAKVPATRNLTDAKGVRAMIYRVSKKDADLLSSASTTATRRGTTSIG